MSAPQKSTKHPLPFPQDGFDIKTLAADKPATSPIQTVNVGVALSPERLNEIRAKLELTRLHFANSNTTVQSNAATPTRSTSP